MTCCFFASLKTLLIPTKATALRRNQRPRASFSLAGFEVTLIGRFWVIPEGEVCGEAENGQEAIEKAEHLKPQVIVLDLAMPLMNGLTAGRILKQMLPAVSLILFTLHGDLLPVSDLRLAGISAVVWKGNSALGLLKIAENLVKPSAA